ncbi:hypothetical protein RIF29_13160 [Crotalaria pallida]|uniref:Uncharacterized protein n=1 Tax=Crotalaria pallida TaxID=3830 RepID=A0AAN9P2J2_CROPI
MKSCHQVTPSSPLRHPDTAPGPNAPPHCTLAKSGHIFTEAADLQQSPPSTWSRHRSISRAPPSPSRHRDVADNNLKKRRPTEDEFRMDEFDG